MSKENKKFLKILIIGLLIKYVEDYSGYPVSYPIALGFMINTIKEQGVKNI